MQELLVLKTNYDGILSQVIEQTHIEPKFRCSHVKHERLDYETPFDALEKGWKLMAPPVTTTYSSNWWFEKLE